MTRRRIGGLANSVSPRARALEDAAYLALGRAKLAHRIQAGGELTHLDRPDLDGATAGLADLAATRRGSPTPAEAAARKRDLLDRVAALAGFASHAERVAAHAQGACGCRDCPNPR
jgi:hypothetical protein